MLEVIQKIEDLNDEQVCKVALWLIDELKDRVEKEGVFEGKLEFSSEEYFNDFIDALGDIQELPKKLKVNENILLIARNFLLTLATDKVYTENLVKAIREVGKTRPIGEAITLLSALKTEIGIGLIIFLALRFKVWIKVVKNDDGKNKVEFEFEIGKKGVFIDALKNLLKW